MEKINKDKKLIDELLSRGVENIYPSKKLLTKELESGRRLRLYCGYDPSASALHIGNAITLNKMAQFQKLGHEVIFLIGSFTGMIGDPTDKKAARQQLTREQVLENAKNYKKQASAYLNFTGNNSAKVLYNSDWSDKLNFVDLIKISANFTVQQMIQRDMFQARLKQEKPIYLHEFLYPLSQAYDSLHMNVDLEIGGNDQMFNMMCGRDLMKAKTGKEKFVLTLKLLTDDSGFKMGKSEGNAVFLNNSPEDMYGKVMSWPDSLLINAFELCTNIDLEEIKDFKESLYKKKSNPRDLKMKLAKEIVRINHGEKLADLAEINFIKTIQKKELPKDIKEVLVKDNEIILDELLLQVNLVDSKSEARRLVEEGAIKIIKKDKEQVLRKVKELIKIENGLIIQRGKRRFIKIKK
jgi:tyrosyl-tRNA synthetase